MKLTATFKTILAMAFIAVYALVNQANANNIAVANTKIHGKSVTSDFQMVRFDVSWENSWRVSSNQSNWDAAWVFVKFRKNGTQNWQHATIHYVDGTAANDGHTQASGATIRTGTDGKGAFIYRSANGTGTATFNQNSLRWDYGTDGVADGDSVNICVFAIEMVYVPQGQFYLGSGGAETGGFYIGGVAANPYLVTSESAINMGAGAGQLDFAGYGAVGTIPAPFPKGFAAFYCMKYETSQGQYAEFLNYLSSSQAAARFPNATGAQRHTIGGTFPNYAATTPNRACNYLSNYDAAAYADWTGLRPMTELEYEKACRGANQVPIANEYAFGSTNTVQATTAVNDGTATETGNAGSNQSFYLGGVTGVLLRNGAFANVGTDRQTSGATYYGIMEMSGNLMECVIMASYSQGRDNFTPVNGNGTLSATGESDVAQWPFASNQPTYAWGYRGGSIANNLNNCQLSDRYYYINSLARVYYAGFRAVRSAN